jgi:type I restriction enzyme M protein
MAKAPKASKQAGQSTTGTKRRAKDKSLEGWMWGAASSIRGQKDAAKFKDFILPLVFTKRLCDVYDDELDRIAAAVGSRAKAFRVVAADKALVRFYLPLQPDDPDQPVWSVIRTLSDHIGYRLTSILREIADANPLLKGILDRVDFNATTMVSAISTTIGFPISSRPSAPSRSDLMMSSPTSSAGATST